MVASWYQSGIKVVSKWYQNLIFQPIYILQNRVTLLHLPLRFSINAPMPFTHFCPNSSSPLPDFALVTCTTPTYITLTNINSVYINLRLAYTSASCYPKNRLTLRTENSTSLPYVFAKTVVFLTTKCHQSDIISPPFLHRKRIQMTTKSDTQMMSLRMSPTLAAALKLRAIHNQTSMHREAILILHKHLNIPTTTSTLESKKIQELQHFLASQGVPVHPHQGVPVHPHQGVPVHPHQGVPVHPHQGVPVHPHAKPTVSPPTNPQPLRNAVVDWIAADDENDPL